VHENIKPFTGDATNPTQFDEASFDVAFSNSVIEQLFTFVNQPSTPSEIPRVGDAFWVPTPNCWFPIELHFLVPGWHWMPLSLSSIHSAIFERWQLSEPQHLRFGGGVAESVLNPFVFVVILVVGALILFGPRSRAIAPFIAASILTPMDQILVIGGLHFPMLRFLALFGIARLIREKISSKSQVFRGINKIDVAVMLFATCTAVAGVVLFQQTSVLIFQLGNVYTIFGVYFLLRFLIRSEEDITVMIRTLAYVAALIAISMAWEVTTSHNPFALLGGARASVYETLMERDNRFRAQGCFGHPILAGAFGAVLVPLFVQLWRQGRKDRYIAVVGIISATVITLTSNSSTPILAYAAGVLALCLWPLRASMRIFRWGIILTVFTLHLVMKAPVWNLIARIDISGGSSSYHRFLLIDECIHHFGDWWFVGVKSTADWGWSMWDTANQYVGICDNSGLLPFILFLAIIVYGFKHLGKARRAANDRKQQIFAWALGATLFANVVAFFGISYWDQTQVVWYGLLAAISAVSVIRPNRESTQIPTQLTSNRIQFVESDVEIGQESIETAPPIRRFFTI
jgi:hypothetical protein